eukprot:TRINITY_DN1593_c0_g1_i2.p1 TRINITY_DN1593_c0_g1~~TRINITY_DN1593_c0_g1_i2.p1  ORF type:complete len:248 (+),score=41.07 TRINITY_DN1593_c0_g1_i2:249-992(+)
MQEPAAQAPPAVQAPQNPVYENGQVASVFTDDGAGMIYYPSGKPAAVVSVANSYQKRFYFYQNDRNNAMIAAFDERMVGFATEHQGRKPGNKLILTKDGGKIADAGGSIIRHWKWDQTRQNPGSLPTEPIVLQMNRELRLTFHKIDECQVKFSAGDFTQVLDCGLKLKRTDCYLTKCTTILNGPERGKKVFRNSDIKSIQEKGEADAFAKSQKVSARTTVVTNKDLLEVIDSATSYFDAYKTRHMKQ